MVKAELQFSGFNEVLKKLNDLNVNTKAIANAALIKTHEIVTEKAEKATVKANYPAGGKYSTGDTERSIARKAKISWKKEVGEVGVGYQTSVGGIAWVFLLRGTPYHEPVKEIRDAFYSDQTLGEIYDAQKKIFTGALEKLT